MRQYFCHAGGEEINDARSDTAGVLPGDCTTGVFIRLAGKKFS